MPQQVDENTKEIAILKKTVSTPAILYNANIEISTSAGVISQSNVIETVLTTDNSYIMDTVGNLFKIINIVNDNIYILYVSSIRGPQGLNGADGENGVGIQSITSIAPTQDDGYTVTPVTFTDTNDNQTTINVRAKNGANNEIIVRVMPSDQITVAGPNSYFDVTAYVPDGYKFLCWLQPSSVGWIGSLYMEHVDRSSTRLYNVYGSGGGVEIGYLLVKEL